MIGACVVVSMMTALVIQAPGSPSDRVDFQEVVRRSPVILSADPEVKRVGFRVSLTFPGGAITMRGAFRNSGEAVLIVFDDFDQTPIAWSNGKTVTVYDPVGHRLLLGGTAGLAVRMLQLNDQGAVDIVLSTTPEEHNARLSEQGGPFLFDLRSIIEADRREHPQADRTSDGALRTQILAPSGQQLDVTLQDVGDSTRWTARSVPRADGSTLSLEVLLNGPPEDRLFERSEQRPVIAGLPVVELVDPVRPGGREPVERFLPISELNQVVLQVVQAREELREERNRDPLTPIIGDLGTQGGRRLLQDQQVSARLRAFWGITSGPSLAP